MAAHAFSLVPPLPAALQLEVTSACNLRCAMCLVRYRPPVNKVQGAMNMDLYRQVLNECVNLQELTLQGLGEPLLHPHLMEMIALAHARGIRVGFNSNATLLTRTRAERLVAAGLNWLHVSLDGATAETYEDIREGANFATVVGNLRGLVAAKRAAASATPWVRVVFVAMRRNVNELPDLVRLLAEVGVDELRVQNLSHDFTDTDPTGSYRDIQQYTREQTLEADPRTAERAFTAARASAEHHGIRLRLPTAVESPTPTDQPGCTWPWTSAYITSAGNVQPCCMVMGDDRVSLGQVSADRRFADIWAGPEYQRFRSQLRQGPPPSVCKGCSLYRGTF